MNCSTPGLPVHHQLLEFTRTHVHRVGDAIQPSHPLSSPLLLPPIPPSIRVFSTESTFHMRWPKYWSVSFSIVPSKEHPLECSPLEWQVGTLQSKGLSLLNYYSNVTLSHIVNTSLQYISQGYDHNSYKDNSTVSCAQKITVIYVVIGTYIIWKKA